MAPLKSNMRPSGHFLRVFLSLVHSWVPLAACKKGGESRVDQRDPRLGRRERRTSLEREAFGQGSLSDAVIDLQKIRPSGFHALKWRWIVERTLTWLSRLSQARQRLRSASQE